MEAELRARGRHDPCVVPRAVPMVEAMVALVVADQLLQHYAQVGAGRGGRAAGGWGVGGVVGCGGGGVRGAGAQRACVWGARRGAFTWRP